MTQVAVSVSDLTVIVRGALAAAPDLEDILVEGEISNLSTPVSGHIYFTLKDKESSVRCVIFRTQAQLIRFRLENGMTVFIHGRVDVYQAQGQYQLYGDRIDPSGIGALALAIEQTRRRLAAEGLFDESRKRKLPPMPRRVVVVTSRTGAAWRDASTIIRRRAPWVDIVLSPATVQGDAAATAVANALDRAGRVRGADVVLLVRGGGSVEDLAAFSDEKVVRAIRSSPVPVIAGIGHETDVTLAEMAADVRAATPSAAAEIAVPTAGDLLRVVASHQARLVQTLRMTVARRREHVGQVARRLESASPQRQLANRHESLRARISALRMASPAYRVKAETDRLGRRRAQMQVALRTHLATLGAAQTGKQRHLEALSPRRVLERGFSITLGPGGETLRSDQGVGEGAVLRTILAGGELTSVVTAPKLDEQMYDIWNGAKDD